MPNKQDRKIWLLPLIGIILTILFGFFIRYTVGTEDRQYLDYQTIDFVPAASPHSTGPDSR